LAASGFASGAAVCVAAVEIGFVDLPLPSQSEVFWPHKQLVHASAFQALSLLPPAAGTGAIAAPPCEGRFASIQSRPSPLRGHILNRSPMGDRSHSPSLQHHQGRGPFGPGYRPPSQRQQAGNPLHAEHGGATVCQEPAGLSGRARRRSLAWPCMVAAGKVGSL